MQKHLSHNPFFPSHYLTCSKEYHMQHVYTRVLSHICETHILNLHAYDRDFSYFCYIINTPTGRKGTHSMLIPSIHFHPTKWESPSFPPSSSFPFFNLYVTLPTTKVLKRETHTRPSINFSSLLAPYCLWHWNFSADTDFKIQCPTSRLSLAPSFSGICCSLVQAPALPRSSVYPSSHFASKIMPSSLALTH